MLAIVTRRFRVPLLFTLLPHQGSSDTGQRIEPMRHYLTLFGAASIRHLFAGREFIGVEWTDFLNENNIFFVIRVKNAWVENAPQSSLMRLKQTGVVYRVVGETSGEKAVAPNVCFGGPNHFGRMPLQ